MNKKAAIYARFSSDNQRDESIDAQIRAIEDYAKRNGFDIVKVYADRAKSATSDKRPEFQKMIQDSSLGLFEVVIVHKLDRFSRDKYDSATYKRKLKQNGIKLVSVTENLDGSPESVILESLLEGMAEYYSKNLAREVMKGMRENAYQCKHTGGLAPLGYDVDPTTKQYIINEKEAAPIKLIFSMYLDGYGYSKILDALSAKGYKTKLGRPFGKNSIHDILRNEKYSGVYVFNKTASKDAFGKRNSHSIKSDEEVIRIPDGMPALVSPEDYQKVVEKMNANKHSPAAYKAKESYLLSGLIVCGECLEKQGQDFAMMGNCRPIGRNKMKYVTYRCGNRDNKKNCDNKELRREHIESFVISELHNKIFNDDVIPQLVEQLNDYQNSLNTERQEELSALKVTLQDVTKQLDNIVSAVAQGFTQSTFLEKMTGLEEQKSKLEFSIKELEMNNKKTVITEEILQQLFGMFKSYVAEKNIPEIKKFIGSYVEKVIVYKENVDVIFKIKIVDLLGGGGGIRTPVRKQRYMSISERSHSFKFRYRIRGVTR